MMMEMPNKAIVDDLKLRLGAAGYEVGGPYPSFFEVTYDGFIVGEMSWPCMCPAFIPYGWRAGDWVKCPELSTGVSGSQPSSGVTAEQIFAHLLPVCEDIVQQREQGSPESGVDADAIEEVMEYIRTEFPWVGLYNSSTIEVNGEMDPNHPNLIGHDSEIEDCGLGVAWALVYWTGKGDDRVFTVGGQVVEQGVVAMDRDLVFEGNDPIPLLHKLWPIWCDKWGGVFDY
jgi:hypothetical protein